MGRRLRTQLPVLPSTLKPRVQDVDLDIVRRKEDAYRSAQQTNFNNRHRAQEQPTLKPGDLVWIRDQDRHGKVVEKAQSPRSYVVQTEQGNVRRNRSALINTPNAQMECPPMNENAEIPNPPEANPRTPVTTSNPSTTPTTGTLDTKNMPTNPVVEMKTHSGRIVKPPVRLDL